MTWLAAKWPIIYYDKWLQVLRVLYLVKSYILCCRYLRPRTRSIGYFERTASEVRPAQLSKRLWTTGKPENKAKNLIVLISKDADKATAGKSPLSTPEQIIVLFV